MKIFIDESGNFSAGAGESQTCCVAALIVPHAQAGELLAEFVALRTSWTSQPEVKSTALTNLQRVTVLRMLVRYDVAVLITAFDKRNHPPEQLREFQRAQGEAFVNSLTPAHNQNARRFATELRTAWLALSLQLMAQLQILIVAIEDIIRLVPNYYAQHRPEELGRWDWIIDPKDVQRTPYEKLWARIICPVLQTSSLESPFVGIAQLDWSAFERFSRDIPDYLLPSVGT